VGVRLEEISIRLKGDGPLWQPDVRWKLRLNIRMHREYQAMVWAHHDYYYLHVTTMLELTYLVHQSWNRTNWILQIHRNIACESATVLNDDQKDFSKNGLNLEHQTLPSYPNHRFYKTIKTWK
jgi:hypothetical protein